MTIKQEFKDWLEADTSRKENLPNWEKFFDTMYENGLPCFEEVVNFLWNTNDTADNVIRYFQIRSSWAGNSPNENLLLEFFLKKKQEFTELKLEKDQLATQFQDRITTLLTDTRQQLDQNKKELNENQKKVEELSNKIKELQENPQTAKEREIISKFRDLEDNFDSEDIAEIEKTQKKCEELKLKYELDDVTEYPSFAFSRNIGRQTFFSAYVEDFLVLCGDSIEMMRLKEKTKELETELKAKEQQLTILQQQSTASTAPLRQEIGNLKKQLQETQSNYQQSQQEREKLTAHIQQLTTEKQELESQFTALALSSSLLTQQCEDLTKKLTESERKEIQTKLEADIKANLLQQKEQEFKNKDTTITEQEEKINKYQKILRTSEENLSKCQEIITAKSEELTKLEEEKEQLDNELEAAQEKIKELERNFLNSQTKILELEARIQELEQGNSKDTEIILLKQQLNTEKLKSQQWDKKVKELQGELASLKIREDQLKKNIKDFQTRKIELTEELEGIKESWWQKYKNPILWSGGIAILAILIIWLYKKYIRNYF